MLSGLNPTTSAKADVLGATLPLVDPPLQAMEVLRDPSHVRDYSIQECRRCWSMRTSSWDTSSWPTRIDGDTGAERMRTPPESVAAIRRLQGGAPAEVVRALALEA